MSQYTDNLVDQFAAAMKVKLNAADEKYGWDDGWTNPDCVPELQRNLRRHVHKGDPLDVANYCAFLWHHGASTHDTIATPDTAIWRNGVDFDEQEPKR